MVRIDRARLDRIRNYQSQEFWAILFARPAAILLLLVVADWRWITPNRLTIASFVLTLATAWLIAFGDQPEHVAAAVSINLAQVLDNADGTLARYRRAGTSFGSYLDKMCDAAGQILLGGAIAWDGREWLPPERPGPARQCGQCPASCTEEGLAGMRQMAVAIRVPFRPSSLLWSSLTRQQ